MEEAIIRLHPLPIERSSLDGLYLAQHLRRESDHQKTSFVYTNFVTSLDGRIAIPHPSKPGMTVPENVANARDWRLFQELAIQADILITTGRYLRDYADGRAQELLRVYEDPRFQDLKEWRQQRELPAYPDLALISGSLNFPVPEVLTRSGRKLLVFTTAEADKKRKKELEAQGAQVIVSGEKRVNGRPLIDGLRERGYCLIYSTSGPKVMHLLLADGVLDRLYLTFANRIIGGQPFSSFVEGGLLDPPADARLHSLYYDPQGLDGLGQLFASYNLEIKA